MQGFLVRTAICALGLWLASALVPSMHFASGASLLGAALLLGVVNAIVRPIAILFTLPLTLLTLGCFLLVINAAMLGLVAQLLDGFQLGDFFSALFASMIVSVTSGLASWNIGPGGRYDVMVIERKR